MPGVHSILNSSFIAHAPPTSCNIKLCIADVEELSDGNIHIAFDHSNMVSATISNTPLANGLAKNIYSSVLKIADQYVFKHVFKIADGSSPMGYNKWSLESELKIIYLGRHLLEEFYSQLQGSPVDYSNNFIYTTAFLAEEVANSDGSNLSVALEISADEYLDEVTKDMDSQLLTMTHVNAPNLHAMTVNTFAHFTIQYTDGQVLFVDLQASKAHVGGKLKYILFDSIIHT
ncbi:2-dehydro-3-deoxyphosphooctonate aldolase [Moniliophthora roreri MCA 2997]|uniref:2-dehydro-3-deoxyphosphooctonate aldolase n=1 Tax=Moniliophthora roreri (strain MCA 2997) TaxID=1381753 RepID=V2WHS7_MONRO|nr:2-dehydro-3-deoxyphosphooctonate aldolase [Moniliophthora roreri MCA 2997]